MEGIQVQEENYLVRIIAKDIVSTYTKHIDSRVADLDCDYINLGVDNTFEQYESLFKVVVSKLLGLNSGTQTYSSNVISEIINVLMDTVQLKGYTKYIEDSKMAVTIFEVCQYVLDRVRQERFADEPRKITGTLELAN